MLAKTLSLGFVLCCLLGLVRCSGSGTLVVITVSGLTPDIQSLQLVPSLNGAVTSPKNITGMLTPINLQIPAGSTGMLALRVEGLASNGAVVAAGQSTVMLSGQSQVAATVVLTPQSLLSVTAMGGGVVTSNPAGINCGSTCTAYFSAGSTVTLTAAADTTSVFMGWTVSPTNTACPGGNPVCTLTVSGTTTVTANFAPQLGLTVTFGTSTGTGTVTSSPSGIKCGTGGTDCTYNFGPTVPVTLTAMADPNSNFMGWTVSPSSTTCPVNNPVCTLTVGTPTTVTANFAKNSYPLIVSVSGNGTGTVTSNVGGIDCFMNLGVDCKAQFDVGTSVTLTAAAGANSTFAGWSGSSCSGTGPCIVTISGATNVKATFTQNTVGLTVVPAGTGSGTVTSSPAGINCGSTCNFSFGQGDSVTLTATPGANSIFAGWSGSGCSGTGTCTVTINGAGTTTVTATFTLQVTITVVNSETWVGKMYGGGVVISTPIGISCGTQCSNTVPVLAGTAVTLTAVRGTFAPFEGWSGGCTGSASTCTFTPTGDTTVTATFGPTNCILNSGETSSDLFAGYVSGPEYPLVCPPGWVVSGIYGTDDPGPNGNIGIEGIQLQCAQLNSNCSLGNTIPTMQVKGSDAGQPFGTPCGSNQAVFYVAGSNGTWFDHLEAGCLAVAGPPLMTSLGRWGGGDPDNFNKTCPSGSFLTGVNVYIANAIVGLGLDCTPITVQ